MGRPFTGGVQEADGAGCWAALAEAAVPVCTPLPNPCCYPEGGVGPAAGGPGAWKGLGGPGTVA